MTIKARIEKYADLFSVHSATGHFWYQRVTAIALIPLTYWLLVLMDKALHDPYASTVAWLREPFHTLAIIAWLGAVIYHAALGVQVVIEDYVSTVKVRHGLIRATNLTFLALGFAASAALVVILLFR
jgi:succinate dehydrogenase / fumarate reductase, membrane anchor subunit